MSAVKKESLVIEIKGGDCLPTNRISGKSNTGTYFISSLKNYDSISKFFKNNNIYLLDLRRVYVYSVEFKNIFSKYTDKYPNKMDDFDAYCNNLLNNKNNPIIDITIRNNDSRCFMRFVDNQNYFVDSLRHVVYSDISQFVIEQLDDNHFYIYPQINYSKIEIDDYCNIQCDEFELDE